MKHYLEYKEDKEKRMGLYTYRVFPGYSSFPSFHTSDTNVSERHGASHLTYLTVPHRTGALQDKALSTIFKYF